MCTALVPRVRSVVDLSLCAALAVAETPERDTMNFIVLLNRILINEI